MTPTADPSLVPRHHNVTATNGLHHRYVKKKQIGNGAFNYDVTFPNSNKYGWGYYRRHVDVRDQAIGVKALKNKQKRR